MTAVDALAPDPAILREAAGVLREGGIVAFPTETFYGLGVAAFDVAAIRRLFALKGRPESRPILVVVDDPARLDVIADVPDMARALIARYWPGPLTLVFRARPAVPVELTAGTGTIGVRQPAHTVARGLAAALAAPVTAPSANRTGAPPPTTAAEVVAAFPFGIDLVLDGGATAGGLPSTVLDVSTGTPRVLRPGAVRVE